MIGKWIGWKFIRYNIGIGNLTGVKMESYLDFNNTGTWSKVIELLDTGGWYARTSDEEFYSAECGIRECGIREIQPSNNLTLTSVNAL